MTRRSLPDPETTPRLNMRPVEPRQAHDCCGGRERIGEDVMIWQFPLHMLIDEFISSSECSRPYLLCLLGKNAMMLTPFSPISHQMISP